MESHKRHVSISQAKLKYHQQSMYEDPEEIEEVDNEDDIEIENDSVKKRRAEPKKFKPLRVNKITGISFLGENRIVAADSWGCKVVSFKLTEEDEEQEDVSCKLIAGNVVARDVAGTNTGLVAYTNTKGKKNNTVEVRVACNGEVVSKWGETNTWQPWGIAINNQGQLIVTDVLDNYVGIYTHSGIMVAQFGNQGITTPFEERLKEPRHVCVDQFDRIIVTDYGNNCIKIFDKDGKFLRTIGGSSGGYRFKHPRGVTTDRKSNIYVCDSYHDKIAVFCSSGAYIGSIVRGKSRIQNPCVIEYDIVKQKMIVGSNGYHKRNTFRKVKLYDMAGMESSLQMK